MLGLNCCLTIIICVYDGLMDLEWRLEEGVGRVLSAVCWLKLLKGGMIWGMDVQPDNASVMAIGTLRGK